jgi:hypothetical protein
VYAQPCALQITNKCLLSLFVDVLVELTTAPGAHLHSHGRPCVGCFASLHSQLTCRKERSRTCTALPSGIDSTALQPHGGYFIVFRGTLERCGTLEPVRPQSKNKKRVARQRR